MAFSFCVRTSLCLERRHVLFLHFSPFLSHQAFPCGFPHFVRTCLAGQLARDRVHGFEEGSLLLGKSGGVGGRSPPSCVFGYVPVVALRWKPCRPSFPLEAFLPSFSPPKPSKSFDLTLRAFVLTFQAFEAFLPSAPPPFDPSPSTSKASKPPSLKVLGCSPLAGTVAAFWLGLVLLFCCSLSLSRHARTCGPGNQSTLSCVNYMKSTRACGVVPFPVQQQLLVNDSNRTAACTDKRRGSAVLLCES